MALSEERRRQAIEIINGTSSSAPQARPSMSPERRQQALAIINGIKPQAQEDESLLRQGAEGAVEGALDLADLPQHAAKELGKIIGDPFELTPGMKASGMKSFQGYKPNLPMASEKIKEQLKKHTGIRVDTKPTSDLGKIIRSGSRFAGSSLGGGMLGAGAKVAGLPIAGKILGAAESIPALAKMTGVGAGIGSAVGASEALGLPPWASTAIGIGTIPAISGAKKIGKGAKWLVSPSNRKASSEAAAKDLASDIFKKQVGEENIPSMLKDFENYEAPLPGYQPLTAETTGNIGLAQMQRAQYGHTPKLGEQQARNDALIKEGLQSIEAAPETMGDIAHRTTPHTTGQELQGQLTKNIEKLASEREAAYAPLQKSIEEHKPGVYTSNTYSLIDKQLETAKGVLKNQLLKIRGFLEPNNQKIKINTEGFKPEMAKQAHEKAGAVPSAHELKETYEQIGDMIKAAKKSGADKRARVLKKVQESLLGDLENTPVKEANKIYAEKSEPITKTKELFGAEAKRDLYNRRYLITQDKASESIISKAMQNPEFAEGFNHQFSGHPESMKVTKGYINNDLHKTVINKNGKINLDKLHSWKISNPHAETIYPGITKKLANLQKKGLVDTLGEYLKDSKNISSDKLGKFIKNNEGMLKESLDENQLKILRGSELALSGRHAADVRAKAPGSPTSSNQELLGAIQQKVPAWLLRKAAKGSLSGQAGIWLYDFFRAAKKAKAEELINAALVDKDVAKLLATHTNDIKTLEATANKLKDRSYIPRIIVMNSQRKDEKDNE